MGNEYMTMRDVLSKPLSQRRGEYGTTEIQYIIIDQNKFGGYKTFSSYWEKTYAKQPERSASGVISNLDSYPTFVTFHLTINFAMMSIDDYRRLYELMLSKNEFIVTAYDATTGSTHTCKMYFAPDQMPKLYAVARRLQGEKFVEVLGVQDYTIELIGTNNDEDYTFTVEYYDGNKVQLGSSTQYLNTEFLLGYDDAEGKVIDVPSLNGKNFSGKWKRRDRNIIYLHNQPTIMINKSMKGTVALDALYLIYYDYINRKNSFE